jgi:hypothetical protein
MVMVIYTICVDPFPLSKSSSSKLNLLPSYLLLEEKQSTCVANGGGIFGSNQYSQLIVSSQREWEWEMGTQYTQHSCLIVHVL